MTLKNMLSYMSIGQVVRVKTDGGKMITVIKKESNRYIINVNEDGIINRNTYTRKQLPYINVELV